jgi:dTDP-4-amino-4,6-dideoxygalactose transaminase
MIPVVKPYLPNRKKLDKLIDGIYERQWLTNNGALVQELTQRLEEYLGVKNLLLVANGTLALQVAYRALGIAGSDPDRRAEAITTPFTFIATASSLKWEGVQPVFADIDPDTWCLKPEEIESAITSNTKAIVPVHVFGNACDVEGIDAIAQRHKLKVIYDASHAFGVNYKGQSVLNYGDAATLSFHATKLFHTIEGGAIVFKHKEDLECAKKIINFGISGPDTIDELGVNAKMNEFQAAMGLSVLDEIHEIVTSRRFISGMYDSVLNDIVQKQSLSPGVDYNYAYYPILMPDGLLVERVLSSLRHADVYARRYFYPSLTSINCLDNPVGAAGCVHSEGIAGRVLCLPIYPGLEAEQIRMISRKVLEAAK